MQRLDRLSRPIPDMSTAPWEDRIGAASRRRPRIAVCFSGGDAPGMNTFLRYLTRIGCNRWGADVWGVRDGFCGLVTLCAQVREGRATVADVRRGIHRRRGLTGLQDREQPLVALAAQAVGGLTGRGGIVLGADRCPEFHDPLVRKQAYALLDELRVATLVVVGGNGSLRGAAALDAETDLQVLGVPATIDNDVSGTDTALGTDTAINTVMEAIERINDTAGSHRRVMVVETMGRDSGHIARMAALAAGAEIVVAPERGRLDEEKVRGIAQRLQSLFQRGRRHAVVVVAEGVSSDLATDDSHPCSVGEQLAEGLREHLGSIDDRPPGVRATILGHLQRGGAPTAGDRILAVRLAESVWQAIMSGSAQGGIVGLRAGRISLQPFREATESERDQLDERLYQAHKAISRS